MDRHAAARVPQARRRRYAREIRLVSLRRGLFHLDRHADRAASADPDDLQVRRRDPAAQLRLPDEGAHADQARLQESEIRDGDGGHGQISRRVLGGPGLQLVQWKLTADEKLILWPAAEPR